MNHSIPKSIKKKLREFSTEAYERELNIHLEKLYILFNDWKEEKMSGGELSVRIFEYNNGASKKLYSKYNSLDADVLVGFAVGNGILSKDEIPNELFPYIENSINFSNQLKQEV